MKFGWCLDGHHEFCIGGFTSMMSDSPKDKNKTPRAHACACECHTIGSTNG